LAARSPGDSIDHIVTIHHVYLKTPLPPEAVRERVAKAHGAAALAIATTLRRMKPERDSYLMKEEMVAFLIVLDGTTGRGRADPGYVGGVPFRGRSALAAAERDRGHRARGVVMPLCEAAETFMFIQTSPSSGLRDTDWFISESPIHSEMPIDDLYPSMIYHGWIMLRSDLPLPPATLFILFALATGEKHGYAIMREARKLSDNRSQMGPATLYTTVQRLLDSRWIEEIRGPEDGDARRRYYRLTEQGKSALQHELERMDALVRKSKALRLRQMESAS
jgi:DNA-binding PadR family transcriptional regulator